MKELRMQVFDSFEEADSHTRKQRVAMSASELIESCYQLSIASWQLHKGHVRFQLRKENPTIVLRDL